MIDDADRLWVDSMPQAYEQWLAPTVFRPFAVDLAHRISSRRPTRVLELAAGTGVLTRELVAALPAGRLVSTDLNAAMVDVGRRLTPGATWREADATHLPFDDGEFDLVACQFGVMFFPDKQVAFTEARRVLAEGGSLVFNTWAELGRHDFQAALVAALERVFPDDPPTFMAAVPHGYPDPDVVARDVRAAGFADVSVDTVTVESPATSVTDIVTGYCAGTPLRVALETRTDLATATAAITTEMQGLLGAGTVSGRMTAHVVEAR